MEKTLGSCEIQGFSHEGFGSFRHFQGFRDMEIPGMTKQPDWEAIHTGKRVSPRDCREYVPFGEIRRIRRAWAATGVSIREAARLVGRSYESVRPILTGYTQTRPGNVAYIALRDLYGIRASRGAATTLMEGK
jgi:hypothetical protein